MSCISRSNLVWWTAVPTFRTMVRSCSARSPWARRLACWFSRAFWIINHWRGPSPSTVRSSFGVAWFLCASILF